MKINELEEEKLRELYDIANETDSDQAWQDVRNYYSELGRRYGFNPRHVMINTKGEITRRNFQTVYAVIDKLTNQCIAVYYDKQSAVNHVLDSEALSYNEVGLE